MFKFSPQRKFVFSLKRLDHILDDMTPKGMTHCPLIILTQRSSTRKLWGTHFLVPHGTIDRISNMWWRLAVSLLPCYWHQVPHSSFTFDRLRLSSNFEFPPFPPHILALRTWNSYTTGANSQHQHTRHTLFKANITLLNITNHIISSLSTNLYKSHVYTQLCQNKPM